MSGVVRKVLVIVMVIGVEVGVCDVHVVLGRVMCPCGRSSDNDHLHFRRHLLSLPPLPLRLHIIHHMLERRMLANALNFFLCLVLLNLEQLASGARSQDSGLLLGSEAASGRLAGGVGFGEDGLDLGASFEELCCYAEPGSLGEVGG